MDDLSIAFRLNDQVITFWQFYVGWNAGVVGWVFSRETAWSKQKRWGVGLGVLLFNIFNISGLYRTTSSLHDIVNSMKLDGYVNRSLVTPEILNSAILRLSTGDWWLHIGPHILADLIVAYFVLIVASKKPPVANDL